MTYLDKKFPETLKVSSSSEMIPFEFFGEIIPISSKIQFKLGYFSSNSISTLSYGFAQFIYNGLIFIMFFSFVHNYWGRRDWNLFYPVSNPC